MVVDEDRSVRSQLGAVPEGHGRSGRARQVEPGHIARGVELRTELLRLDEGEPGEVLAADSAREAQGTGSVEQHGHEALGGGVPGCCKHSVNCVTPLGVL